jgi:hypothetical protein
VSFYTSIYYVDSTGLTETLLVAGSSSSSIQIYSTPYIVSYINYVPDTTLPDLTYRYRVKVYANFASSASATFHFRDSTNSHVHTTLVANAATGPTGPAGPAGPQGIPSAYTGALQGSVGSIAIGTSATLLATTSITTTTTNRIWAIATLDAQTSSNQAHTLSIYMKIGTDTSPTYTHTIQNKSTYYNISHHYRSASLAPGTYTITVYGLGDTAVFTANSMQLFSMSSLT